MRREDVNKFPSRPFQGFDCSEQENVTHLIEYLYGEYAAWYKGKKPDGRLKKPKEVKQHLTHFVLEAFRTYRALPGMSMGVHLGKYYYNSEGDRYHPSHLSCRIVVNVTDFLVAAGYLDMPLGKGEWDADPSEGWLTRFRPTYVLMHLCREYGINLYMIKRCHDPEVIILRAKREGKQRQGNQIDYKDIPFTLLARKNLKKINEYIAGHNINLDITDDQEEALRQRMLSRKDEARDKFLDFTKTHLRRIFNNDCFKQGGRFYGGWWEEIFSEYRHFITINGKRTVGLDYSGMHFAIMYADLGMNTPMEDPYALESYSSEIRSDIKKAFHIIINCSTRKKAIETINSCIREEELSADLVNGETLLEAFEETHPLIGDKIASGEGIHGMFVDSQIAERILLKGIDIDLCILPIHDGFITTAGDEFVLERLMNEAFKDVTGHTAGIKPETFDVAMIADAWNDAPYWITRSDGTVERDGRIEGKATSFSQVHTKESLWERIEEDAYRKTRKNRRDEEWELAHGK